MTNEGHGATRAELVALLHAGCTADDVAAALANGAGTAFEEARRTFATIEGGARR